MNIYIYVYIYMYIYIWLGYICLNISHRVVGWRTLADKNCNKSPLDFLVAPVMVKSVTCQVSNCFCVVKGYIGDEILPSYVGIKRKPL